MVGGKLASTIMLTGRQKEILDFVQSYQSRKGYSPSLDDIRKRFKYASVSTPHHHLKKLKELGYLRKEQGHPRAIDILKSEPLVQIPLVGFIAAGEPIEAIENQETIAVPQRQLPLLKKQHGDFFALRVAGDSMVEENINDGDIVLIKQQNTAQSGEKVVALLDGYDATLKTLYRERGRIRLQPANRKMSPVFVDESTEIDIQGVVVDVIKTERVTTEKHTNQPKHKKTKSVKQFLNNLFHGDVMDLLAQLPDNSIDTVFGDPDYNVGIKYGDRSYTRGFDEYIEWYINLTREAMRVLKKDGNLFMLNYPKQNAHLRVRYLDNQLPHTSEYVWVYNTNVGHSPRRFTTAHRSVLHVRKSKENKFYKDHVALPYKNPTDKRIQANMRNGSKGRMPYSWFEHNLVKNVSREKTYHACQIPQRLTETLIKSSTKEKDIVLVLFGGSGAEIDVCKKLNRHFISAEIDEKYCALIEDRLQKGTIDKKYRLPNRRKTSIA